MVKIIIKKEEITENNKAKETKFIYILGILFYFKLVSAVR